MYNIDVKCEIQKIIILNSVQFHVNQVIVDSQFKGDIDLNFQQDTRYICVSRL